MVHRYLARPSAFSSETLIGKSAGVVRASAIKRFGEKSDVNAILEMKGTPQQPDPKQPGLHIPIGIRLKPEVPIVMPGMRPARTEDAPKWAYLKKYNFQEHGYTEDGEGCARLMAGMPARPHAEACRTRMYEAVGETETGRKWMGRAEAKIDDHMTVKVRGEDGRRQQAQDGQARSSNDIPAENL